MRREGRGGGGRDRPCLGRVAKGDENLVHQLTYCVRLSCVLTGSPKRLAVVSLSLGGTRSIWLIHRVGHGVTTGTREEGAIRPAPGTSAPVSRWSRTRDIYTSFESEKNEQN